MKCRLTRPCSAPVGCSRARSLLDANPFYAALRPSRCLPRDQTDPLPCCEVPTGPPVVSSEASHIASRRSLTAFLQGRGGAEADASGVGLWSAPPGADHNPRSLRRSESGTGVARPSGPSHKLPKQQRSPPKAGYAVCRSLHSRQTHATGVVLGTSWGRGGLGCGAEAVEWITRQDRRGESP